MKWNYLSERGFGIKNKTKPKKTNQAKTKKTEPSKFFKREH